MAAVTRHVERDRHAKDVLSFAFKNYRKAFGTALQDSDTLNLDFQSLASAIQEGDPIVTILEAQKVDIDRAILWTDIATLSQVGEETCHIFSDPRKTYVLPIFIEQKAIDATCYRTPLIVDGLRQDYFMTSPDPKLVL